MWTRIIGAIALLSAALGVAAGPAGAEEATKKLPVSIKADKLDYDRANDMYVAEGNVRIEQEGMRLEADRISLNNKTGEASADGKVYLQEKGDIIRADKLSVNINTKSGVIFNGDLFMGKENLHLKGEKIERRSETVYHIEKGTFTTCDQGEWYLSADEIDVDMDRYATGKGVSFNMVGLPVFYTPYLLFPVRRQSGLLIPEPGFSNSKGFLLKNSFFWAISDFADMTFYSDYRARYGLGTGIEYRYINSRDSGGNFFYNYFNTFDEYTRNGAPDARWLFSLQHHEEMAEDLSIRADVNLVSDYAYFRDLEKKLELRSQPYLDSNLFYVERWETASLHLLGQYGMDLTTQNNDATVQKLPELRYTVFEEKVAGGFHFNFDGSATNFTRRAGHNIMRADFNPRLSAVMATQGLTLVPRLGARATYYDRSASSAEPSQRKYYYAGADLNARFSRIYGTDSETGFGRTRHSIEPGISYNFIPRINQPDIPQLDAVDFIAGQNVAAISLINRLTAHYRDASGFRSFDVMVFRLSEAYDLSMARSEDQAIASRPRSELRGELSVNTPKLLTLSANETYDTYAHAFTSSSESVIIRTETKRLNFSRQYLRSPLTKYMIAGAGTKMGNWDFDAQLWRDMVTKEITQQEYRAHYTSQCWGFGVVFDKKPGETQYLLTLDLKGLGALKF